MILTSRHLRTAAIAAVAASSVVPAVSGNAAETVRGWTITRTTAAPRRLTATVTMTAQGESATVVVLGLSGTASKRAPVVGSFDVELGTDAYPRAYHDGPLASCPTATACAPAPIGQSDTRLLDTEQPVSAIFYVAALRADVRISDLADGWVVRAAKLDLRVIRGENANATGLRVARTPVEHFTSAELAGGRYGSAVLAALPCGYGPIRGSGSAKLTGAGQTYRLDCAGGPVAIGAHATGPATWRLAGDATGIGFHSNRLVVFNYPRI